MDRLPNNKVKPNQPGECHCHFLQTPPSQQLRLKFYYYSLYIYILFYYLQPILPVQRVTVPRNGQCLKFDVIVFAVISPASVLIKVLALFCFVITLFFSVMRFLFMFWIMFWKDSNFSLFVTRMSDIVFVQLVNNKISIWNSVSCFSNEKVR